jgi:hypothetical protein
MSYGLIPKKTEELNTFKRFAEIARLPIDGQSIGQPDPPDVVCRIGGDQVAFELAGIRSRNVVENLAWLQDIERGLYAAADKLAEPDQSDLRRKFSDALVGFEVKDGISANAVKALATDLLAEVISVPDNFAGEVGAISSPKAKRLLAILSISRGNFLGPVFTVTYQTSFLAVADSITATLEEKFAKPYECDCPIELVLHIDGLSMCSGYPHTCLRALTRFLDSRGSLGRFRRIWLVDLVAGKIELVRPE